MRIFSHLAWSNHRAPFPPLFAVSPEEVPPERRLYAPIRNIRRNIVTAAPVEMYGNCTWLTYRLGMAPGREVSSGCITGATSGRRQRTRYENHPPILANPPLPLPPLLLAGAASYTRDRVRSSSIVWLRETLPDGYTRPCRLPWISTRFSDPVPFNAVSLPCTLGYVFCVRKVNFLLFFFRKEKLCFSSLTAYLTYFF